MKNLYLLSTILFFASCSLTVTPENEIAGDDIINTAARAHSILAKAYSSLHMAPEDFTVLSEDLQPSYLIDFEPNVRLYYNWNEQRIANHSALHWDAYYHAIAHLNIVLHSDPARQANNEEWKYIIGNAHVLKAFIYFDLLQLFSLPYSAEALGIVPKDQLIVENNARISQRASIALIEDFIKKGLSLMENPAYAKPYYINQQAGQLLLAEVALFKQDYATAAALARSLIDDSPALPNTEAAYQNIWKNTLKTKSLNAFWAYDLKKNPNKYLPHSEKEAGDILFINTAFLFDSADMRKQVYTLSLPMRTQQGETIARSLLGKYRSNISDLEEQMLVIHRPTEAHFILMECLLEQNKLSEATAQINHFLSSVNLPPIPTKQSQQDLRAIFRLQKQKEFIGERINFFDLKRWQRPIARKGIDSDQQIFSIQPTDFRWTWPIPTAELRHNPNCKQNPNWRSF